jgi:hypothetical protein
MTAKQIFNKENTLVREVWRKAWKVREERELVLQFPNEGAMKVGRIKLYNAVRGERRGEGDWELVKATEELMLCNGEDGKSLIFRQRKRAAYMGAFEAAVGESYDKVKSPEEREAEEAFGRRLKEEGLLVPGAGAEHSAEGGSGDSGEAGAPPGAIPPLVKVKNPYY